VRYYEGRYDIDESMIMSAVSVGRATVSACLWSRRPQTWRSGLRAAELLLRALASMRRSARDATAELRAFTLAIRVINHVRHPCSPGLGRIQLIRAGYAERAGSRWSGDERKIHRGALNDGLASVRWLRTAPQVAASVRTARHIDDVMRFDEWLPQDVSAIGVSPTGARRALPALAFRPTDASAARIQWRYYTQLRNHGATDAELEMCATRSRCSDTSRSTTRWLEGRCELEGAG